MAASCIVALDTVETHLFSLLLATQDQLDYLREQIEMRCIGLSWTDWVTPWSSSKDSNVGTVAQLTEHLKAVLAEEQRLGAQGMLPSKERALASADGFKNECPAPQMRRKTFKALGTPTVQADALCGERTMLSADELAARALRRRSELEAAGEIDWVGDRQPYPTGQVRLRTPYFTDRCEELSVLLKMRLVLALCALAGTHT